MRLSPMAGVGERWGGRVPGGVAEPWVGVRERERKGGGGSHGLVTEALPGDRDLFLFFHRGICKLAQIKTREDPRASISTNKELRNLGKHRFNSS